MLRRLIYLILVFVAVVVVALIALATPPGRGLVSNVIEKAASGSGLTVTIDDPSGWPPFSFGAGKILLADADGTFAEIDGAHVGVKVLALLGGKLAFSSIRADRVALDRRPNLPGGGSGGAALPFAADSVTVARVDLAADVIGRAAALSLEGSLVAGRSGALSGQVNATRVDGIDGSLVANFARANGSAPFAIDVTASEDADGILVGLLGQSAGPAYSLSAKTNVNGNAVAGTVQLQSRGAAHFMGDFSWAPQDGGPIHVMAKASGDLAELVPTDYADLLAGPIALDLDADWTPPAAGGLPAVAVRQGEFSTANVRANLSGSLSGTAANLTLKADASKNGGGALALPFLGDGASAQSFSLTGQVAPKDTGIRLDLIGHAQGLVVSGNTLPRPDFSLAVEAPRAAPLAGGSLPFGLRVETDAIRTAAGQITASANAPIVVNAGGTFDTASRVVNTDAKFAIGGGVGSFDGSIADGTVKGTASAEFGDLSVLSPLAGRALGGSFSATIDGTLVGPQSAFKLTATGHDLDVGEPAAKRLLSGETQATAVVGIKDGVVSLDDVSVSGQAVTATGSASLSPAAVSASLSGGISDLSLLADNSSGAATFEATVSGSPQQPNVDATIKVASGQLVGKPIENASVRFTGSPSSSGGWQGELALAGQFASGPLSGTAHAALDSSGTLSAPDIDLAIGANRITGAVVRSPSGPLSGTLNIAADDIKTLAALFLIDASGTAGKAALTLAPDGEKQSLHATFSGSQLAYRTASTQTLSGDVSVADLFGTPVISGNVSASDVAVGDFHLTSAKVTASAEGAATRFTASAQNADLNLSGSGRFAQANGGSQVTVDTLTGTAYRLPVQLTSPVTLNLGSDTSRLSGATLALGGGTLTADGTVSPNLNLTLVATSVGAAVANGFVADLNAEGSVSGRATITGTVAAPRFAWQVNWQGLRVAATRNAGLPPLAVTASGSGDGKSTTLSATIGGLNGLSLTANGQVPYAGPGLSLAVSGTAPLALLALQSSSTLNFGGDARVNLTLTGSFAAIATNGTIDLNGATIADTNTGFGISGARGRITFNGHQATTQQISGQMIQGGSITIAGSVTVDAPGLPANLTGHVANGRYADGRVINTAFSADLALNGPLLAGGTLSGTLTLGRTEIQLPDRLAGTATAIPVKHINTPPGFHPPQLRQAGTAAGTTASNGGLRLDLTINGGQSIFVRGFGIDSEFGGSLRLTGTMGNPTTIGAFTMNRGRIEVLGRRFDFQSGTLTFSGTLVPILSFTGTTTTTDSTVTLTVSGPANNPQISFSSSPSLPEEEIVARLLFNQSVGKLSPLQAAQLVDAIAQLTGAAGNGGIFARIREATGLDDLDIRQSATGGTTVGVAKRINDNLQVGVEAGTDPNAGRVTIDLNLSKNLKARAAAGQSGSGEVGLTYEREY